MASASSSKNPRDLYIMKQKAMKYYEENGVPQRMEEVLNSMFYEDPSDVYGHLVNFFSQYIKPATLSKLQATQVMDAAGMPTIMTNVICKVNNNEKLVVSSTIPSANLKVSAEDREKAELELSESVAAAIDLINTTLSSQLSGHDPRNQADIDVAVLAVVEKLREDEIAKRAQVKEQEESAGTPPPPVADDKGKKGAKKPAGKTSAAANVVPERPSEMYVSGSEVVAAVSQAVCACAAAAHGIPVYRHIANIGRTKGPVNEFRIPLPMVTIIQSGKQGIGKSNCIKEYMVVPGINMSIEKSIHHIQNIYNYVAKSFASKNGPAAKFVNESGALCPAIDVPTQGLDLLQEAVNAEGLTIGEDFYLAINAAAHEFFDFDKGRYEFIAGQQKTSDDMVEFWADLVSKYPSILCIIDPLRGQDIENWMKLCERVSECTYIVGDHFYVRPGCLNQTEIPSPVRTSGIVMYLEKMTSVSDIYTCATKLKDLKNEILISTNQADTTDTFIVDLAVGLNARFLKVGGPSRGERSCKLNRLLQIFKELELTESPPSPETETPGVQGEKLEELKEEDEDKEAERKAGEPEVEDEARTGDGDPSVLKAHAMFSFPLIQNPPPPEEPEALEGADSEETVNPNANNNKKK